MKDVATVPKTAVVSDAATVLQVIERAASNPQVDIDKLERLLQMRERMQAQEAKAAYAGALAALQPELPLIREKGAIKNNAGGVMSRYALWEDVVEAIAPHLSRHGFSLSFRTSSTDKTVTVIGVLTHAQGHSEDTSLTLPLDTSGAKSLVQTFGSSTSYGKRYTAAALLNLRTGEVDDDGRAGAPLPVISEEQAAKLQEMIEASGANKAKFLQHLKIESVASLPAQAYEHAMAMLRSRMARVSK